MQLNYQVFEEGSPASGRVKTPLIVIPGLFGSVANWRSIAKNLSTHRSVYVIDQRNHGRSPHSDQNGYADMVADLNRFMDDRGLVRAHIAGHSMGGKVAMLFTLERPEKVASLCVLDIAPITYSHSHAPFLEALLKVDLTELESRAQADRALQDAIPDTGTRLFLLQNLGGSPGAYRWRINLRVLHQYMDEIVSFPSVTGSTDTRTLVIAGANSTYLRPEHKPLIQALFTNCQFKTVDDAGHWLHAEQPARVTALMEEFLES